MCKICAENYVVQAGECKECQGGANYTTALIVLLMCGIPVILVSLLIMLCTKDALKMDGAKEKTETLVGQIKILVAFLQIISSLPSVMDGIPWPKIWVDMAIPFTALNIDVHVTFI